MKRLYLIVLSHKLDRNAVLGYLADLPSSGGWFYNMPHSFFLASQETADELSKLLTARFGKLRHFITEVSGKNRQGLLPKKHWELLDKAQSSASKDPFAH